MQSENHESLYRSLADTAVRVKTVLDKDSTPALMSLTDELKLVMDKLGRSDIIQDPGLIEIVKKTQGQVNLAIGEIGRQRDELGGLLAQFNKKVMVSSVYAGNKK